MCATKTETLWRKFRAHSTTTRDRNLQFRGTVSIGFFESFFQCIFPHFSRLSVKIERKPPQNVEKIARYPGGERGVVTEFVIVALPSEHMTLRGMSPSASSPRVALMIFHATDGREEESQSPFVPSTRRKSSMHSLGSLRTAVTVCA